MTGLYIHIPFCKSRCLYCGFYSTTLHDLRQRYVDAVCKEMTLRGNADLSSIYMGGGTPSQLTADQLRQIFNIINNVYRYDKSIEITIECNPDDINEDFAKAIASMPFNRVSLGVQTFDDNRLRFINRRHNAAQAFEAVRTLRQAGIDNISIDLMYGFPGETAEQWQEDIKHAISLDVNHISAYSLMYEEGTPLYALLEKGDIEETDEETSVAMFDMLIDMLTEAGYEHYEISNFAKHGYQSRHNSSYWCGKAYIGIGAAAHSYDIGTRHWNISDVMQYISSIEKGVLPLEYENIDDDTRYNDMITTALRTREGIDLDALSSRHRNYCLKTAQPMIGKGLLAIKGNRLQITREGIFVSDMIMSELIYIAD